MPSYESMTAQSPLPIHDRPREKGDPKMLHTITAGTVRKDADKRFRLAVQRHDALQYLGDGIKAGWVILMGIALAWLLFISPMSARIAVF